MCALTDLCIPSTAATASLTPQTGTEMLHWKCCKRVKIWMVDKWINGNKAGFLEDFLKLQCRNLQF